VAYFYDSDVGNFHYGTLHSAFLSASHHVSAAYLHTRTCTHAHTDSHNSLHSLALSVGHTNGQRFFATLFATQVRVIP
jgi:hypothetical protein